MMTTRKQVHPIRSLSSEQLQEAVARLRAKYPHWYEGLSTYEVRSECIRELGGLFTAQTSTNKELRRYFFFRVRPGDELVTEDQWTDPKRFSYPPPEFCKRPGRCHIPGHPVFYGADSYDGAILEMKRQDLNEYYVSTWYTDEISLEKLNLCYASNIKAPRLLIQRDRAVADMRAQYPDHSELSKDRMEALLAAWSDLFIGDSYGISASIAHQCMYGEYREYDALVYGSALDGSFVNYALHPRLADTMTLHKVLGIVIGDSRGNELRCCAEPVDGKLAWREPKADDLPENDPFLPTSKPETSV